MRSTYQGYLLLLAALISPTVLASPMDNVEREVGDDPGNDPDSAPHNENGAAILNPDFTVTDNQRANAAGNKKCFTFTSDNPNWSYALTGPWGSSKAKFGNGPKKICVPHNDNAGGAMYIGSEANPGPGNTKLECFIPSAGKGNCDMSLVDGYSLSVTCDMAAATESAAARTSGKRARRAGTAASSTAASARTISAPRRTRCAT